MTAVLLPNGKQQYFYANGDPLVGGKVYTFDSGTSTPRTTWQDQDQIATNTNPIVLDARGEATIYWSGSYRVRVEDSLGNVIWTRDGVSDLAYGAGLRADLATTGDASRGAGLVAYTPNSAYSSTTVGGILNVVHQRTAAEIAALVTPSNYGIPSHAAVGVIYPERYSSNNDTAIANAFLVAAQLGGATVELQAASYTITSKKTIPDGTVLRGGSMSGTVVNVSGAIVGFSQEQSVHIAQTHGQSRIENICFKGTATALGALLFDRVNNVTIDKCKFIDFTAVGAYGAKLIEVFHWQIQRCYFENLKSYGALLSKGTLAGCNSGVFGPLNEVIGNNQAAFIGLSMENAQDVTVCNNDFEGSTNGNVAIEILGCDGVHIFGNYIELWVSKAIKANSVQAANRVLIEQNVINGSTGGGSVVDLNNAGFPNSNITVRQNNFADVGAGQVCIDYGNTTKFVEYNNAPNLGNITNQYTVSQLDAVRGIRPDTGTLTGCTTSPTATVRQERIGAGIASGGGGGYVMLQVPTLNATSNTTACTITGGISAENFPARAQQVVGRIIDNGASQLGLYDISVTGVITLAKGDGSTTMTNVNGKGFSSCTVIYSLN